MKKHAPSGSSTRKKIEQRRTRRIERSANADSTRQAVLHTPELLERILLRLPAKSIFGVKRVCSQFRDVIESSQAIQERLFLRLKAAGEPVRWTAKDAGFVVSQTTGNPDDGHNSLMPTRLSPLLHRMASPETRDKASLTMPLTTDRSQSWRKTFLSDPPCKEAEVNLNGSGVPPLKKSFLVMNSRGVLLGNLVDAYRSEIDMARSALNEQGTADSNAAGDDMMKILVAGSWIQLRGMIIPTDKEWTNVK